MQEKDQPYWLKISEQDKIQPKMQLRLGRKAVMVRTLTLALPWLMMGVAALTTQSLILKPGLDTTLQNLAAGPVTSATNLQQSGNQDQGTAQVDQSNLNASSQVISTSSESINTSTPVKQITPQKLSNPAIAWPTAPSDDEDFDEAEDHEEFEDEIEED